MRINKFFVLFVMATALGLQAMESMESNEVGKFPTMVGMSLHSVKSPKRQMYTLPSNEQSSAVSQDESRQRVKYALVQVYAGYIPGTRICPMVNQTEAQKHEQAVNRLSAICKVRSLQPIANLGVYFLSFMEPMSLDTLVRACKSIPGFEKVYDLADIREEAVRALKEKIVNERFDAWYKIVEANAKEESPKTAEDKVALFKGLSVRTLFKPSASTK